VSGDIDDTVFGDGSAGEFDGQGGDGSGRKLVQDGGVGILLGIININVRYHISCIEPAHG
jgi:hypothetical protein